MPNPTPVARVNIIPSILPDTQNPMNPPTVGALTLTAINPGGNRTLTDLSEVLPTDTSIVAVVDAIPGGSVATVFVQNRRKPRSLPAQWNTANPVYVTFPTDGTYDITFTITGDSDSSTVANLVAVKRP